MEQQNTELQQAQTELVQTKSKAFEMVANITSERDSARQAASQFEQMLQQIAGVLELEGKITTEQIIENILTLKTPAKAPAGKGVKK